MKIFKIIAIITFMALFLAVAHGVGEDGDIWHFAPPSAYDSEPKEELGFVNVVKLKTNNNWNILTSGTPKDYRTIKDDINSDLSSIIASNSQTDNTKMVARELPAFELVPVKNHYEDVYTNDHTLNIRTGSDFSNSLFSPDLTVGNEFGGEANIFAIRDDITSKIDLITSLNS